ncbi:MAG: endonuclease/exonuclease/phosphatase family protein [Kiritimatiellia bacterium]
MFLLVAAQPALCGETVEVRVMAFNVLTGGAPVSEVGAGSPLFRRPRHTNLAEVIRQAKADLVCVNEPPGANDPLLPILRADDPDWRRRGGSDGRINIQLYSRFPIEPDPEHPDDPTLHQVRVTPARAVIVHTIHWWPAKGYGPDYVQKRWRAGDFSTAPAEFEADVLAKVGVPATYRKTVERVKPHLAAGRPVLVLGDFNEPSHLDWTDGYAARGADRWVRNPTAAPLRPRIAWEGSRTLLSAGLQDAYRVIHPDPVANPGNTWTPPYAAGTPGRRPWEDQVLDRIDFLYFAGDGFSVVQAAVIGEARETSDIVHPGPWPSDHRAVLSVFRLDPQNEAAPGRPPNKGKATP